MIRDQAGHLIAQIERSDFATAGATVWTGRLEASSITLSLRRGDAQTELEIRAAIADAGSADGSEAFSLQGKEATWRSVYPTTSILERETAETVGILVDNTYAEPPESSPDSRASWCCSGVMVGSDLFLTNWHCAGPKQRWDGEVLQNAVIDLAWEKSSVRRQFSATDVVAKDVELDYAILRVRQAIGLKGGRTIFPARISRDPLIEFEPVSLIHHASCRPKLISDKCRVQSTMRHAWTDPQGTSGKYPELTHDCDSEPGASGGPIFDAKGRLIAIHHLGHQKVASAMCPADRVNKAVKISAIMAHVRETKPGVADELGW
ncbi:hypothetical protein TS85_05270 [Sphingomonas hengshuiensis]|uniref:Serine protease n=2 Tax=Sphingomonas hengshuiensis TaxID=1609977 RepID=A0A7U4J6U0_9SPHN|nr:hypothetical protein TS85_05270 [Sphingomonas hengshuiensis]